MTLFISKFPKAHPDYFSHILLDGDGRGRQRHWLDEAEGTGVCFVSPVDGRHQDFPGRWICWNKSVERLQKTQKDSENSPNDLRHSLFSEFQGIFCNCSNECIRAFDDQVIWVLPGGCCVFQGTPISVGGRGRHRDRQVILRPESEGPQRTRTAQASPGLWLGGRE